jgi:hypothetical protein
VGFETRVAPLGFFGNDKSRISRTDAVNALDQIVTGKAVTAGRTMAYARACFAWGKRRSKVPENPFADLPISAGATERERALSDAEIAHVWAAADTLGYPFGPFYKLLILTLQRREEVAGMRWTEIAPDLTEWRIPSARMKAGKPHIVHLSEAARAVLRSIPRIDGCDLVFTTTAYRAAVPDAEPKGKRKTEPRPISGFSQGKRYLDAAIAKSLAGSSAGRPRLRTADTRASSAAAVLNTPKKERIAGVARIAYLRAYGVPAREPLPQRRRRLRRAVGWGRVSGQRLPRHITIMAKIHPHAEATYRIVSFPKGGTFGVEVAIPETHTTTVTEFATHTEAEAWIARHKSQVKMNASSGSPFRRKRGTAD